MSICREEAKRLANRLKKISVADIIESMTVTFEPFCAQGGNIWRIYKLEMKFYEPPDYAGIEQEDWEDTLQVDFVRGLEDAIESHVKLLKKIMGIKDIISNPLSEGPDEGDEDFSGNNRSPREEEDLDDGEDEGENGEGSDDLGLDAQKRKQQSTDEMDYEDDSGGEANEEDPSAGSESENDNGNDEVEFSKDDEIGFLEAKKGPPESPSEVGNSAESQSMKGETKSRAKKKKSVPGKI